jgi:ADP-heptose:LPS heptosyltransferase
LRRLIIRPGAIGDCILALPAMEFLRLDYTEVWVASQNVPLIRFADRVRSIASTGLDRIGIPGLDWPAFEPFDSIVSWYGTGNVDFRAAVAGLPFTFLPALPDGGRLHAADFFLSQVAPAGGPAVPKLDCPRTQGDYIVIQPFSGGQRKNWPLEHYRELASRLPGKVQWCAGPEETLEDAVRFDNLYDLACRLGGARLYIGNDSGITHLAAAAGAPVIALFGPTDPAVWAPRGERVCVVATPARGEPMASITVERVLAAAETMLRQPA